MHGKCTLNVGFFFLLEWEVIQEFIVLIGFCFSGFSKGVTWLRKLVGCTFMMLRRLLNFGGLEKVIHYINMIHFIPEEGLRES